jgi:sec-independent protein translocase protein TatB
MFSIDFPEIIIIFGVALVVLGPKKLPGAAAKIGRWVGRARTMARQFREQLEQEVSSAENSIDIRKSVDSAGEPARQRSAPDPAAARTERTPAEPVRPESAPHEAMTHGTAAQEAAPLETGPHERSPYEFTQYGSVPPAEGYGAAPHQLSFDEQLHNTALPPAAVTESHPGDARDWMPETQTWMASAGWETPEPGARSDFPA